MKAVTYSRYGPPSVLQVEEIEDPRPAEGEVLVRVRAVEVTKSDCELRSFNFSVKWFVLPLRLAIGVRRPRRRVLGGYFSGEIVAVGPGVTRAAVGERVFGGTDLILGAYAELLVLRETAKFALKPKNLTFVEAAAVPLGGLNALHFMRRAAIRPGERVLVNGAGGSIGGHAVQIAKAMGAHVTAVDHGRKREVLTRIGADRFLDYTKDDVWSERGSFDVVFDMVPTSSYSACVLVLRPGGRYLCGNPRLSVMLRSLITSAFTKKSASFAFAKETAEELETLRTMAERGEIRPFVDRVFEMEQAAEAHHVVETEQRLGTIVLAIGAREGPDDGRA